MEVEQVEASGKLQVFSLGAGLGRNGDSWLYVEAWGKWMFNGRFRAGWTCRSRYEEGFWL